MRFPDAPNGLTTRWLSEVLGTPVERFRVEPLGEGAGVIGLVCRVHLNSASGASSLIAKFPSPVSENRAVAQAYDMYGREVGFYRDVAPEISLRVPACYHADLDSDSGSFVLLLEDLRDLRTGDQVRGCTHEDARRVIQAMARLHASTWGMKPSPSLVCHDNADQRQGMISGFQHGWPVVQSRFGDLIPAECRKLGETYPEAVPRLLATMCRDPMCVAHADVRLDNVMFGDDDVALVDWQSVCISAPEQDLAYFVTQSLPDPVRRAEDWVAVYHDALVREGITTYDLAHCRERYRTSALYLLCYAVVIAGTLDLANERGMHLARTLVGNAFRSLTELRAFSLLK